MAMQQLSPVLFDDGFPLLLEVLLCIIQSKEKTYD